MTESNHNEFLAAIDLEDWKARLLLGDPEALAYNADDFPADMSPEVKADLKASWIKFVKFVSEKAITPDAWVNLIDHLIDVEDRLRILEDRLNTNK